MRSDAYRNEAARYLKERASLQAEVAKHVAASAKARAEASSKHSAARKATSSSTRQMHERSALSAEKKVADAEKKLGDLHKNIAAVASKLSRAESNRAAAEKSEEAAAGRAEAARLRKEKSAREARDRDDDRRRRKEKEHARDLARLSSVTVMRVLERAPEPEKLRVLYLTANPDPERPLRVDAEVNNVMKALRGAKHRDLIELHQRPAATHEDLVDGINDLHPHVIHFSGHGDALGLSFDTASFERPEELSVSYDALAELLKSTDFPPTLLVLNGCQSSSGVTTLLEAAPVVIAMTSLVGDMVAGVFATHFYAAIGGAQSIGAAVGQAQTMLRTALPDEPDPIALHAADGVNVNDIQLVKLCPSKISGLL